MIIDPIESLLMIWHPAKEIDHAHFILSHQKFVELFWGVGGSTSLKVDVLRKSSKSEECDRDDYPKE